MKSNEGSEGVRDCWGVRREEFEPEELSNGDRDTADGFLHLEIFLARSFLPYFWVREVELSKQADFLPELKAEWCASAQTMMGEWRRW